MTFGPRSQTSPSTTRSSIHGDGRTGGAQQVLALVIGGPEQYDAAGRLGQTVDAEQLAVECAQRGL